MRLKSYTSILTPFEEVFDEGRLAGRILAQQQHRWLCLEVALVHEGAEKVAELVGLLQRPYLPPFQKLCTQVATLPSG